VFAYMAGHGAVVGGEYYFVAHDTTGGSTSATAGKWSEEWF